MAHLQFLPAPGPAQTNWLEAQLRSWLPMTMTPWAHKNAWVPCSCPTRALCVAAKSSLKFRTSQAAQTQLTLPVSCQAICRVPCLHQWCAPLLRTSPTTHTAPAGGPSEHALRGRRQCGWGNLLCGSGQIFPGSEFQEGTSARIFQTSQMRIC